MLWWSDVRGPRLSPAVIVLVSVLFVLAAVAGYLLGPSRPRTAPVPAPPPPAGLFPPGTLESPPPPVAVPPVPLSPAPPPDSAPTGPARGQVEPAAPAAPPVAAPIPNSPSRVHVQAGAFNIRENAEELVQQLRASGYTVTLVESGEGPRYRVRVGGDLDRAAAERVAATLRAAGFEAVLTP